MKSKAASQSLWSVLALSAALFAFAAAYKLHAGTKLNSGETKAAVTELTSKILEDSQFAHHQLDDELAGKFLDRYLDSLDGEHLIFLQSDVDEFTTFLPQLARATRNSGDTSPAQKIFHRYLDRLQQRATYDAGLLKAGPFDFSKDEHYQYDRKDAPRPSDVAAAEKLWRDQLRFEYLQEKLAGKVDAEITQILDRRATRLVGTMRKFNDDSVLELYLNALAHVYDPHSDYMGHEELASFNIGMNLSLVGIGATLQSEDGYCKINALVPGGPAARSGLLKNGDRIVGVAQGDSKDFTDLVDMPLAQAVDLIRGKKGTTVRLSVIPAGAADSAARKAIAIVRDNIKLEDQQAKARIVELPALEGKTRRIGVIDLPGFYASQGDDNRAGTSATADVSRLLRKLQKEKITGLILDLRRNGGGSLEEAINLTGLFIPSGPVVQTRTLDGRVQVGRDQDGSKLYDGPLMVLTSRFSASASEILAGALQDYGRAIIVGDTSTFGKGTVQTIVPLSEVMAQEGLTPNEDPGALKVTISKFYRPSGKSTQLAGVKSDIVLPSLTDMPEIGEAKLDNPLPWDTIPAARFKAANRVAPYLDELKIRSAARIATDPDFAELLKDRERITKMRESKSVSLNEAARRQENGAIKTAAEARKKERLAHPSVQPPTYEITLMNLAKPGLGEPLKHSKPIAKAAPKTDTPAADEDSDDALQSDDVILREAEQILGDYSGLLSRKEPGAVVISR